MSLQLPLAVWGAGPPASTTSSAAGTTDIFNIQYSAATADCRGRGLQAVTSSYFHFKYLSSSTPHHITQLCSAEIFKLPILQHCRGGGGEGSTVLGWLCVDRETPSSVTVLTARC